MARLHPLDPEGHLGVSGMKCRNSCPYGCRNHECLIVAGPSQATKLAMWQNRSEEVMIEKMARDMPKAMRGRVKMSRDAS